MPENNEIDKLTTRVESLEKQVEKLNSIITSRPGAKVTSIATPVKPSRARSFLSAKKSTAAETPVKKKKSSADIEFLLGGNILGKLGVITILLALTWFIKMAFENHWINESGRIFLGLVIATILSLTGTRLATRRLQILPFAISGAGFAAFYITIFSSFYFYNLIGRTETFVYLMVITSAAAYVSWKARSQLVYIFSLVGAFMAPILLSSGENSYRFLFSYLAVLVLVFSFFSHRFAWRTSGFIVTLGSYIVYMTWSFTKLSESSITFPFVFLLLLFLATLYREKVQLPRLVKKIEINTLILSTLNIVFFVIFSYVLVDHYYPLVRAHYLLLIAGILFAAQKYSASEFEKLNLDKSRSLASQTVLVFSAVLVIFAALTDFAEDGFITFSWILLAGILSTSGAKFRSQKLIIIAALFWFAALMKLYFYPATDPVNWLVLNSRFALYVTAAAGLGYTYFIQRKDKWKDYMAVFSYLALFTLLAGSLYEMRDFVDDYHYRSLSYSYVLAAYAGVLLAVGFVFSFETLRRAGMVLVAVVVLKLYLFDIWQLSRIVRIIAGFSLGALLVITSIYYQKFKDRIFPQENQNEE